MSSPRNPTGRRIPRLGEDVCARIRKQCSASQPAGDTSKPDEISIPTATGQEFFVFKGSDGMVRENLVCDQVVPKKKKHRHLNIKPNPSGEKISYGQLERCGLLGKVFSPPINFPLDQPEGTQRSVIKYSTSPTSLFLE